MLLFCIRGTHREDAEPFVPVSPRDSDEALRARVEQLSGDENEIYKWLREFYSDRWIAETLLLDAHSAKAKLKSVYFKLGVKTKGALMRTYGHLERPQKSPVDTEQIDRYIDTRAEKEVQHGLKKTAKGEWNDG